MHPVALPAVWLVEFRRAVLISMVLSPIITPAVYFLVTWARKEGAAKPSEIVAA